MFTLTRFWSQQREGIKGFTVGCKTKAAMRPGGKQK